MYREIMYALFSQEILDSHPAEWGVIDHGIAPSCVGFATTLTPDIIHQAVKRGVNLLVTHHDAWDFMYEEKEAVRHLLKKHQISCIWCHSPLDESDFGTAVSLLKAIGCSLVGKIASGVGRIGQVYQRCSLQEMIELTNKLLGEHPCKVFDADKTVYRVATVTGAGIMTGYLREALSYNVDLYITGETSLYLLEYARFHQISVLIYSHNYTEMLGVKSFAEKIADILNIPLEPHFPEPHF